MSQRFGRGRSQLADLKWYPASSFYERFRTGTTSVCNTAHWLKIKLQHFRAGNAVLVKLVDQEDLTREFEDDREELNINVGHVIFNGSHIVLPDGVALSC